MFSGIVKGRGRLLEQTERGGDRQLVFGAPAAVLGRLEVGASIAVNGACLTAIAVAADAFTADVSGETLKVTRLGKLRTGEEVNLEPALRVGDPVDGHWVTGHVDGIGHVVALRPEARSIRMTIALPPGLGRYVARKGSIAVDGVSFTVNGVDGDRFDVNVIPYTRDVTVISRYENGTPVNIEVDLIARYVERLQPRASMSLEMLERHGYASND